MYPAPLNASKLFAAGLIAFGLLASQGVAAVEADPQKASPPIERDVQFFVLVKSSNYSQATDGQLSLLNYHFFSEVFPAPQGEILGATLSTGGVGEAVLDYKNRGKNFYYEGGHFETVEAVDAAHPNGVYQFGITTRHDGVIHAEMSLAGPGGATDIPEPIHITLSQGGKDISPVAIDPARDLDIRWSDYSNGRDDPRGIVDDMIFVVVADCHGERLYHTGLPFGPEDYMRHGVREITVPARLFRPGEPYSMFVEFPHVVDSVMAGETPGFTSYATATYLDMKTAGEPVGECPAAQPPMDTGQTDRMDVEIESGEAMNAPMLFDENYTMLYYAELGPAAKFYGEVLGLEPAYEDDWVRLYKATANSFIGVVKTGPGAFHAVRPENSVMVSLVTGDVDAVHARVKSHPEVEIVSPLQNKDTAPIRAFIMKDPGGYTVEVFQWLKK